MTSPADPPAFASDTDIAVRFARQAARTAILFGVDFLPLAASPRALRQPASRDEPQTATAHTPPAPPVAPMIAVAIEARPATPIARPGALDADRAALLDALRERHDTLCPHCTRATAHSRTVFGEGDPNAALMFIGEAPGAEEDRTGRPFVGRAGQKLDEMIRAMGLARASVYIANVLKARPPDNATPTPEEAENCGPFLRQQIDIIRPRVIVALGRPATQYLLNSRDSMSNLRGRWAEYAHADLRIPVMPTFHPAYLLRAYTKENREKVWSDLQAAMRRLQEA